MSINRRILSYHLFRFFQDFALVYPVYVIMFSAHGLDFNGIARLLAIWAAAVVVLELPSGILADLWSKPAMLALGMLLKAAGFMFWWLFPGFAGFAFGFVLWGAQETFCSGTSDALLYELLEAGGRQDEFETQAGRAGFWSRLAIIAALLLGGLAFSAGRNLVLALSVLAMVLAAVCAMTLRLPAGHTDPVAQQPAAEKAGIGGQVGTLIQGTLAALKLPGLALYILFGTAAAVIYGVLDEYDFIFGEQLGVPLALIGIWGATRFLLEGLGSAWAERCSALFKLDRPRHLAFYLALAGLVLVAGTLLDYKPLLVFYFCFYALSAAAEVVFNGQIQRAIARDSRSVGSRATISSFVSLVYTTLGIGIGLVFGWIAERFGLRSMFVSGGALLSGLAVLYAFFGQKVSPTDADSGKKT